MNKALFLDRDGVIIVDKHYLKDWNQVELIPGAGESLKRAQDAGYKLFIVSNQSGIGRGKITPYESDMCFKRTLFLLEQHGVSISAVYVAPEAPDRPSIGRKPSPHFVLQALREFNVDPKQSFFIGDRLSDLECGKNAGLLGNILVLTGEGEANREKVREAMPESGQADDLADAVEMIIVSEVIVPK
jgi:D-glycero-D-manno-heptose 1,7-bisphosphate phosphatase